MPQTVAQKDHLVTHTEVGICLSEFSCLESGLSSIETSLHLQLQIDCTWGRYYMLASLRETVLYYEKWNCCVGRTFVCT